MECKPWRNPAFSPCRCFWNFVIVYFVVVVVAILVTLSLRYVSHILEAECEALLTMPFLPELDAFFLAPVDGAAFFPLLVPLFFPDDGRLVSEPKSLPGSSISIAMESTDPASSSSASARPLAFPLLNSISTY